jgi:hypothetical protein
MSKATCCYKKKRSYTFDIFGDNSATALYTFDNTLIDTGGNYNLSVYDNLDQPTYVEGIIESAVSGTNTGFTTSAGTYIIPNNNYTISCWARQFNKITEWTTIVAQGPDTGYGITYHIEKDTYNVVVSNGDASSVDTGIDLNSTWQHVIISSDGSNGAKAYLNGSWVKDLGVLGSNGDFNNTTNSTLIKVYRNNTDGTFPFPGDIDHLRIFNRAVTASEVLTLYNER